MGHNDSSKGILAGLKFFYLIFVINEFDHREFKQEPESPSVDLISAGPVIFSLVGQNGQTDNLLIMMVEDTVVIGV